jgi:hypothetical protein
MLPDFPKVRSEATRILEAWFEGRRGQRLGIMQQMKNVVMHEGHRTSLHRWDGSVEQKPMKKLGAPIRLMREDLEEKGFGAVLEALDKTAQDIADKQGKFFIQRLKETLEEAGQTIEAKGQPLTFDLVLDLLEKIEFDFDEHGQPIWPSALSGPSLAEKAKAWTITDEQKQRLEAIVERKRITWRDREGDRKLVS